MQLSTSWFDIQCGGGGKQNTTHDTVHAIPLIQLESTQKLQQTASTSSWALSAAPTFHTQDPHQHFL